MMTYLRLPPAVQAALLRAIVGNPFRPVTIGCAACKGKKRVWTGSGDQWCSACVGKDDNTSWLTPNVLSLAAAIQGGEPCPECKGKGKDVDWHHPPTEVDCPACAGSGRTPFVSDPAAWLVLADALEEAGATDAAILNHCRGLVPCRLCDNGVLHSNHASYRCGKCSGSGWMPSPVPHVRGDWVLDLFLGLY